MADSFEDPAERLAELEREASYRKLAEDLTFHPRRKRWRTKSEFWGLPLVEIAIGPDLARGELRGHARGIIAIGDIATGIFACGGVARGVVAFGGVAIGVVTFGGASVGLLAALGGAAMSAGFAAGGAALGGFFAIGGAACGYFAIGGAGAGAHVIDGARQDLMFWQALRDFF